jgi:hypothetical protein
MNRVDKNVSVDRRRIIATVGIKYFTFIVWCYPYSQLLLAYRRGLRTEEVCIKMVPNEDYKIEACLRRHRRSHSLSTKTKSYVEVRRRRVLYQYPADWDCSRDCYLKRNVDEQDLAT